MSLLVISRKRYAFMNPGVKLIEALDEQYRKGTKFETDKAPFCEVLPGHLAGQPNAFGKPTILPDWAKRDGMFVLAVKEGDLVVLPSQVIEPESPSPNPSQGEVAAALETAKKSLPDSPAEPPDDDAEIGKLEAMSKAELFSVAARERVEVSSKANKADFVAAIYDKRHAVGKAS
jgi:hypothetical protein